MDYRECFISIVVQPCIVESSFQRGTSGGIFIDLGGIRMSEHIYEPEELEEKWCKTHDFARPCPFCVGVLTITGERFSADMKLDHSIKLQMESAAQRQWPVASMGEQVEKAIEGVKDRVIEEANKVRDAH